MRSGSPAARAQPRGSLPTSLRPLALLCLLALLALPARAQDPASASPSATPSVSSTVSPSYNPAPSAAPPPLTALAALATPISFGLLFQRQAGGGGAALAELFPPVQSALCASVAQALGVPYSALAVAGQGPLQWAQLTPFGFSLPPGAAPSAQAGHRVVLAIDGAVLARLPAYTSAAAEGTPALVAAFKASLVSTTAFLTGLLRTQPRLVELLGYSTSEALAAHFSLDPTVPVATAASSAAQLSPFLVVAWAFPLGLVLAGMLFVATKRALCSSGGNSGSGSSSSGGGGGRSVGGRRAASARAPRASTLTSTPSRRAAPAEPEGGGWLGCMDEPTCLSPDPEPLDTPAPVMLRAVGGKRGGGEGEVGAVGGAGGGAGAAAASAIEAAGSTGEALPVVQVALTQGQGDNDLEPSSFASPSNGAYKTP